MLIEKKCTDSQRLFITVGNFMAPAHIRLYTILQKNDPNTPDPDIMQIGYHKY